MPGKARCTIPTLVTVLIAAANGACHGDDVGPSDLRIGGMGGVYFLASPGELTVEVVKRDRNRRSIKTELRAILVGPDREVLQEEIIPDDGQATGSGIGPAQRVLLSAQVPRAGVYGLNVTVSRDRYGDHVMWGFRTNCPKYLIETARGHRDERRQEPIVLLNPERPGNVCFLPRNNEFGIEINGLPKDVKSVSLYDGNDQKLADLPVSASGQANHTVTTHIDRDATPWRLFLPRHQATVHIDGVTRWDARDIYNNLPYWTPEPTSFFPFQEYRWLVTPYSRNVHGRTGETVQVPFQVHNNSPNRVTVQMALEFPKEEWSAKLSQDRIEIAKGRTEEITVDCVFPADQQQRTCRIVATPVDGRGFTTYSTLTIHASPAQARDVLTMPMVLKPYQHENEQFGHVADFPVVNQPYFDLENRPFVAESITLARCAGGRWNSAPLRAILAGGSGTAETRSFGVLSPKIAFDENNRVYLLARSGRETYLLCSADDGLTFSACLIPGREDEPRSWDLEQFSGHNTPDGPPSIVRFTRTASDPKLKWRRINDLELFLPKFTNGVLTAGEPILISDRCIGLSAHSGTPSTVVSRNGRVHVVWGEATEPDAGVPGVPAYAATYDESKGELSKPALLGYGPPANDIHNTPSITMDSKGYLHILTGTHGQPFPYSQSLKPNDCSAGWSEPVPVGEGLRTTYVGLVCGPDDTLHMACRLWRDGHEAFPSSYHAALTYFRKPPGAEWEEPRPLVLPPFSEYSVYYHRLTIDRTGRLFLSYDYWSTFWFYRTDHRGSRRTVLMSPDGGQSWKLAGTEDLVARATDDKGTTQK